MAKGKNSNFLAENAVNLFGWVVILAVVGVAAIVILGNQNSEVGGMATAKISEVTGADHIMGPEDATVTLVEYSDFQCPYCAAIEPIVMAVLDAYPDDVRFVYRHFPLNSIHPNAQEAAVAAEAADRQGKFWEMHDLLFINQQDWSNSLTPNDLFIDYAEQLGLDVEQFEDDIHSNLTLANVNADLAEAVEVGINSTPTFFLNGENIGNPASFEGFAALVDQALAAGE